MVFASLLATISNASLTMGIASFLRQLLASALKAIRQLGRTQQLLQLRTNAQVGDARASRSVMAFAILTATTQRVDLMAATASLVVKRDAQAPVKATVS
jgi:hypothetical protein